MKKTIYDTWLLFALLAYTCIGCTDEVMVQAGKEQTPEGMERLSIRISGTGLNLRKVQTRAGMEHGADFENAVDTVTLRVYKSDGTLLLDTLFNENFSDVDGADYDARSNNIFSYLPKGTLDGNEMVVLTTEHRPDGIPVLDGLSNITLSPSKLFYMSGISSGSLVHDAVNNTYSTEVWLNRGVAKVRASFIVADDAIPDNIRVETDSITMQLLNVPSAIRPFAPYGSYKNPAPESYPTPIQTMQTAWSNTTARVDLPAVKLRGRTPEIRGGKNYYPLYTYENFVTDAYNRSVSLKVNIPLYQISSDGTTKIYLKPLEKTVALTGDVSSMPEMKLKEGTLLRNYIYSIDFIVKSAEKVEVCTDMLEWEDEFIYDILGTYLTASGIEMDKAGSIPCNFQTDGDTLFVDWTDMPAEVKRSGTQVAGMSSDYTLFTGLTARSGSIPLEWTDAAKQNGEVKKSYMGFIRDLKLRVGNINRTVQISYIPTLVVDCHVIDMPLYAYVEGGTSLTGNSSGTVSYYGWNETKVLKTVSVRSPGDCPWLKLSTSREYADGGLATSLSGTKAYLHCEENPYHGVDRCATVEYTLPDDLNAVGADHIYQLRIKQVVPIFVGFWGSYQANPDGGGNYTEALYAEQIEELEYGPVPYTLSSNTLVAYTDSYDGYTATFKGYRPAYYNKDYTSRGPGNNQADFYAVLNYCAFKNRADGSGNIPGQNQKWFAPAQFQLAGMIGLADRYEGKMEQPLSPPRTWHYSSTDCGRGPYTGAWGCHFGANRIGLINWGHYDDNLVRCVRTGEKGQIEVRTENEISMDIPYKVLDLTSLPGNYRSNTTLHLGRGASLGDERSTANTVYKKLRISSKYANDGNLMTWAAAVGLPDAFNNQNAGTATASQLQDTGCNAYSEKGDSSDKGTWRLPTAREAAIMSIYSDALGLVDMSECWTQTDANGATNRATHVRYKYTNTTLYLHNDKSYKTNTLRARCVREEN